MNNVLPLEIKTRFKILHVMQLSFFLFSFVRFSLVCGYYQPVCFMARSSAGGGCICSLCLGGISLCSLSPSKSKHTYVRWCEGESSSQHLW